MVITEARPAVAPELAEDWIPEGTRSALLDGLRAAHGEALERLAGAREDRDRAEDRALATAVDYRRRVQSAVQAAAGGGEVIVPDPPPELDPVRADAVLAAHALLVAQAASGVVGVVALACRELAERTGELEDFRLRAGVDRAAQLAHIERDVAEAVSRLLAWCVPGVLGVEPEALGRVRSALAADLSSAGSGDDTDEATVELPIPPGGSYPALGD